MGLKEFVSDYLKPVIGRGKEDQHRQQRIYDLEKTISGEPPFNVEIKFRDGLAGNAETPKQTIDAYRAPLSDLLPSMRESAAKELEKLRTKNHE